MAGGLVKGEKEKGEKDKGEKEKGEKEKEWGYAERLVPSCGKGDHQTMYPVYPYP